MHDYIPISYLNDFVFCPYSIYLHNVYKGGDEDLYHATPQTAGRNAHQTVDEVKRSSFSSEDSIGIEVYSQELGLMGKIDVYRASTQTLVERKNKISKIYQGQIWQLYAQYFCMQEMGYPVSTLQFYAMSDHQTHPLPLPSTNEKQQLQHLITRIKTIDLLQRVEANPNKCQHCIYNNLCDKTQVEHVY